MSTSTRSGTPSASSTPNPSAKDDDFQPPEPCTATAALFLFAHKHIIYCLRHDTLQLERKLDKHKFDITLLSADNVSDQGAGRLAVSYDVGTTAIVWDLFRGVELGRFASYESVRVATWLKDGRLAFGDVHGDVILFDASSSEHTTTRTINDPINTITDSPDGTMLALGYQSGSILVALMEPHFTIIHALSTARLSSPSVGLAWHGTLSKSRTEMLATQAKDGDLRVWAVPKPGVHELARIIRVINAPTGPVTKAWCSWSKSGRLVQYCDGDTRLWDVRAKSIKYDDVPTVENILALAAYGPSGALFSITQDYRIQQYDLSASDDPHLVTNSGHLASHIFGRDGRGVSSGTAETPSDASGSDADVSVISPFQKIAASDIHQFDDEERDQLGPLSPASSKSSSVLSYGSRRNRVHQTRHETPGSDVTVFSGGGTSRTSHRGQASRMGSAAAPTRSSALRQEILQSPAEARTMKEDDLFPETRARLTKIGLKVPQHSQYAMTIQGLQKELLSVVFDWHESAAELIRVEQRLHKPGSTGSVLLSRWLGDTGANALTQMKGSESMTSSDWMMLALSAQLGEGSQRAIGESFVRRLLEMGEIHPAVAILLSMGESNVAVEVYSLHQCFLEAILLNCVVRPSHWESQSQLLRRWGEWLITQPNMTETAVRCFSCASMKIEQSQYESSTEGSASESDSLAMSTPISPPAASRNQRLAAMNAPLKLITDLSSSSSQAGNRRTPNPDTIISLDSGETWRGQPASSRDRSESRTATPGSYTRQRLPSAGTRTSSANRRQAGSGHSSRASSQRPGSADTPSTVRTAKPPTDLATLRSEIAGLAAFQLTGPDRRKSTTPSISVSDTAASESSKAARSQVATEGESDNDGSSFLEDASRRVSHMMSMQAKHSSPDELHPPVRSASASIEHISTQHQHRHTRHASENVSQTRSRKIKSGSPPSDHSPSLTSSHASNDRSELSRKQLAALELEERRRSLLRRPSIPVIPHPSELVPQARSVVSSASTSKSNKSTIITLPSTVYSRGSSIERSATAGPAMMLRDVASHAMMRKASKEFDAGQAAVLPASSTTGSTATPSAANATPYILQPLTYSRPPMVPRSVSAPPEEPIGRRGASVSRTGIETIPETPRPPIPPTPSFRPQHQHRPAADERVLPQLAQLITSFPPPTNTHPALRLAAGDEDEEAMTDDDDESSGIIHIGIDDPNIISPVTIERARSRAASFNLERERERAKTVSPGGVTPIQVTPIGLQGQALSRSQSRGGQTPVSGGGGGATSSLGSMWHSVGRRIRSGSRSSAAAGSGGTMQQSPSANVRMPYETNLDTLSSAVYDGGSRGGEAALLQRGISPASAMQGGYRTPKEIREQMVRDGLL